MSQRRATPETPTPTPMYWRSPEALAGDPEGEGFEERDRPPHAPELEMSGVDRRTFLGIMGASLALGGVGLPGCRKPEEKILPYSQRPEDLIPGKPRYFATVAQFGSQVLGLLVESQDGRPTKVDGNPRHPANAGATHAWAQASVLDMYAPDRSQRPVKSGGASADWNWKASLWQQVDVLLRERIGGYRKMEGKGLAVLIGETRSPTVRAQLARFAKQYPKARLFRHDAAHPANALAGAALVGAKDALPLLSIDQAAVVVSIDCDFLGVEGESVRNAAQFAAGRRVNSPTDTMNRLYAVEPAFTVTGANADHRLQIRGSEVGAFLAAVAGELFASGVRPAAGAEAVLAKLPKGANSYGKWVPALARDLAKNAGKSLIVVGERQPAWVHALGHLINASLGNIGRTVQFMRYSGPAAGTVAELATAIANKEVEALVMLGGNPAYDAPADLEFGKRIAEVPLSIHHSAQFDETSRLVTWHIPASHYLEAWGDLEACDGTSAIRQPLIAPLFDTLSEIEVLARIVEPGTAKPSGYDIVRGEWKASAGALIPDFEGSWRRWLHDGVIVGSARKPLQPALAFADLAGALPGAPATAAGIELTFQLDPSVYDGRWASNAWMQELPDPITKLTWDNAALIGPKTADRLGVKSRDLVEIGAGGRKLRIAVFVTPGVADETIALPLGYGRTAGGEVAKGRGFNTYSLRTSAAPHFAPGATVEKVKGSYKLASTQAYGSLTPTIHENPGLPTNASGPKFEPRPILRETTLEGYRKDPHFVDRAEVIEKSKIKSLFTEPHPWTQPPDPKQPLPQQWGMSIDLNACIGCNACTVACQSENNIAVVGKERVLDGRELSWIRLDRYYSGSVDDPRVSVQPVPCQQCENAPCETVCPVNATVHSPEGLNDMAYNRCIGTRYCGNNCPYKVRRFNYFNFNKENDEAMPLLAMQRNPDVTVRFRGVMEKCTYCVQRINQARIDAKRDGDGRIPDGAIVPACGQACPTKAIVFGDISDPNSAISKIKKSDRDYTLLAELNTKPRTTYLAALRNPNPELA